MILHLTCERGNLSIGQLAAEMVQFSMDRRESVCSVHKGIPLVTYPNDIRTRDERIKNLIFAFMDSLLRAQMITYPIPAGQTCDTRFDPQFKCEFCEASAAREKVLREALEGVAKMARMKMPDDEEIASISSVANTVLRATAIQKSAMDESRKMIKT